MTADRDILVRALAVILGGADDRRTRVTPQRDAIIRRRAQQAYAFAVAELERFECPEGVNYMTWVDSPEYRAARDYRSWLYDVKHVADYRRRHPIMRLLRWSRHIGRVEQGEYGEPAARFSWRWQNLDSDLRTPDHSPSFGPLPLPDIRHEGRAWFDWYVRASDREPLKIEVDWAFGSRVFSTGISAGRSAGGTVTLHAAIRPLASLYVILKHVLPRGESRTYSISLYPDDLTLHYDFGKPGSGDEWHRDDPLNWMRGVIHPVDALLGRPAHSMEKVGPQTQAIASFPEGDYPLLLQREIRTWKRPRWPWPLVHRYVDIEAVRAAESQGKGENSWDCGPDAIWGMSSPGHSYEDAVAAYVKATLRDRAKRGHLSPEHRSVLTAVAL